MSKREKIFSLECKAGNFLSAVSFVSRWLLNKEFRAALSKNKVFKNTHKGETCFIVGNGPSLKYERDLERLRDHFVFSVNQIYQSPLFQALNPNVHIMVDPLYFSLDKNDPVEADLSERMRLFHEQNPNIAFFLPFQHAKAARAAGFSGTNDFFVFGHYKVYPSYNKTIDLCGFAPVYQNVIQVAIYIAFFMGFSRIVLLGVDQTDLLSHYVKRGENDKIINGHIYESSEAEQKWQDKYYNVYDNCKYLELFANTFRIFKWIHNYAEKRHVKILNASKRTALDMFEFTNLDEELAKPNGKTNDKKLFTR